MSIKKPYLKTFSNVKIFGSAYRSDKINHGWVKQIFSNLPNDIISEILYVTFNVKASRILSANIVCGNGVNCANFFHQSEFQDEQGQKTL